MTVVVPAMLPLAPRTVSVYVPLFTGRWDVIVNVDDVPVVAAGLKPTDIRLGTPVAVSATDPLKPALRPMVMATLAPPPRANDTDAGDALSVIDAVWAAVTVRLSGVLRERVPLVPVTVSG